MVKKEQVSYEDNKNINKNDSEGNVNINDLKQLITSLGESQPVKSKYSLTSFPKPSCGKLSDDSDEESCSTKDQGTTLKKKTSKSSKLNKLTKLVKRTKHSIPSPSSASKQSHFYGIPNFVNNLTSYESVKRNIKEILSKLTKKVKRSSSDQTNKLTEKSKDDQNEKLDSKHTTEVVKPLKRKRSLDSTSADSNLQPKIKKIDQTGTNLFTKLVKEEDNQVVKDDLKVFGLNITSNLNPYQSVSLIACNSTEKDSIITRKSKSDSAVKYVKESDSFKNFQGFLKTTETNSIKINSASSKSSLSSQEELLATKSHKAHTNEAECSEENLKVERIIKQEAVCETSVKCIDTENNNFVNKTDASSSNQTDCYSTKKETQAVINNNPFHDILTLIRKEDRPTEDQIIQNISKARERMFKISQNDLTPHSETKSAADEDFHFYSKKSDKKNFKINCGANFSPTEQPFHDLLTLKRKSEIVVGSTKNEIKKTEFGKESLEKNSKLAETCIDAKGLKDTCKTFSRKRQLGPCEGTPKISNKRLKISKSFTGSSCLKPGKSLKRSKSCSFILSKHNRTKVKVDFSKPLKTIISAKTDCSTLEDVVITNNFKSAISENTENCYVEKPIKCIPQTPKKNTDFPSCSSGVVESETSEGECKMETSLKNNEEQFHQLIPDAKGLFEYYQYN